MNDTKYAYAIVEPHSSLDGLAQGPFRHANIMFGHASPVAHLQLGNVSGKINELLTISCPKYLIEMSLME